MKFSCRHLMRSVFLVFATVLVSGCAIHSRPIPYGYSGPIATAVEGMEQVSDSSGHLFVISTIDGSKVHNAIFTMEMQEGYRQSYGRKIYPATTGVRIPARKLKVVLVATTYFVGSRGSFASETPDKSSGVFGEVEFEPVADKFYRINGKIGRNGSEVWIEDYETKEVVTTVVRNF